MFYPLNIEEARKSVISTLTTCPQFDLTCYIKKDPTCYGCNSSSFTDPIFTDTYNGTSDSSTTVTSCFTIFMST